MVAYKSTVSKSLFLPCRLRVAPNGLPGFCLWRHEPSQQQRAPSGKADDWGGYKRCCGLALSAEGFRRCGRLAVGQTYEVEFRGYPPAGEARDRRTFWAGLLLGLLGGASAVLRLPETPAERALGNSEGESGWGPRRA